MLNQVVIVGRITRDIEILDERCVLQIVVPRSFKNEEGGYDTDFIEIIMGGNIAQNVKEYCKKGDLVGVKGRVQSRAIEGEYKQEIVAEKVTFLSNQKGE